MNATTTDYDDLAIAAVVGPTARRQRADYDAALAQAVAEQQAGWAREDAALLATLTARYHGNVELAQAALTALRPAR